MLDYAKFVVIFAAATSMAVAAVRHREWRGGLALLSALFLAASMNELESLLRPLFPDLNEPELPLIIAFIVVGIVLAVLHRGTTRPGLVAVYRNRRFPLLVVGLCAVSFLPNLASNRNVWELFAAADNSSAARETVEHVVEAVGNLSLFLWSFLFLKDKYKVFERRVSPLNHLVFENELVEVGRGTRRVAYRVGDTGYCVKFYYPQEQCIEALKMQKSIQRDVRWRRFNKARNSSSREVYVYDLFRHSMPPDIRARMPEVCERVYHEVWGWGVIETYYTNPDGTAILPYEDEIARQTPDNRERIYAQAVDFLEKVSAAGVLFYEPGNFHVLLQPDGGLELKLIDFEPESKTAIPLEMYSKWFRRRKLARKANRYLAHIRSKYGVRDVTSRQLAAERTFGVRFARFDPLALGNSSANYKAVAADGRAYLVKFTSPDKTDFIVRILSRLSSPLVPSLSFGGKTGNCGATRFFAMEWLAEGQSVDPADLSSAQIDSLLAAYADLSQAMGPGKIHGDLHYRNIFFVGDRVRAFLDFEKLRDGAPTDDLLRIFLHALDRTRFWRVGRLAAIERNFRTLVERSGYPADLWRASIDRAEEHKIARRREKSRHGWTKSVERWLRAPLYAKMRRLVAAAYAPSSITGATTT